MHSSVIVIRIVQKLRNTQKNVGVNRSVGSLVRSWMGDWVVALMLGTISTTELIFTAPFPANKMELFGK